MERERGVSSSLSMEGGREEGEGADVEREEECVLMCMCVLREESVPCLWESGGSQGEILNDGLTGRRCKMHEGQSERRGEGSQGSVWLKWISGARRLTSVGRPAPHFSRVPGGGGGPSCALLGAAAAKTSAGCGGGREGGAGGEGVAALRARAGRSGRDGLDAAGGGVGVDGALAPAQKDRQLPRSTRDGRGAVRKTRMCAARCVCVCVCVVACGSLGWPGEETGGDRQLPPRNTHDRTSSAWRACVRALY
jgi:hypothetical protein